MKGCRVARLRDSTSQEACARRARIFALTTGCDMLMYRRLVGCGARRKDRNTRLLECFRRLEREGAFMYWTCACCCKNARLRNKTSQETWGARLKFCQGVVRCWCWSVLYQETALTGSRKMLADAVLCFIKKRRWQGVVRTLMLMLIRAMTRIEGDLNGRSKEIVARAKEAIRYSPFR